MSRLISKQSGRVDGMLLLSALALVAALAGIAYNLWQMSLGADWDEQYRSVAAELRVTTQELNVSSREAFSGDVEAFSSLAISRREFPAQLSVLRNGDASLPAPGASMELRGRASPLADGVLIRYARVCLGRLRSGHKPQSLRESYS